MHINSNIDHLKKYEEDYDSKGIGFLPSAYDHKYFSNWDDWVNSIFDESESPDQGDGYADNNGFYRMSLSHAKKKDPDDFFEDYKKDFIGHTWKPNKFFQRLYLKNIMAKTAKLIDSLLKVDISKLRNKAYLKEKIQKANREIRIAQKKYDRDPIECLIHTVEALQHGKKVLEFFKKLDVEGRLDD